MSLIDQALEEMRRTQEVEARERERRAWDAAVEHMTFLMQKGYPFGSSTSRMVSTNEGAAWESGPTRDYIGEARDNRYPSLLSKAHIRGQSAVTVGGPEMESHAPGQIDPAAVKLLREREPRYAAAFDRLVAHALDIFRVGGKITTFLPPEIVERASAAFDIEEARAGRGRPMERIP